MQYTTSLLAAWPVALAVYACAFLPVGWPVLRQAWQAARKGDLFTEFSLMSVASVGAFCIGEFPEGVAVMLLYCVGERLQDGAVDRANRNISKLLDVRPDRAAVVTEHGLSEQDAAQVAVGETVEVMPGQRVPLDGKLLGSDAEVDTSALTGESVPRHLTVGSDVLAGMIVIGSPLRLRVSKPYNQSTLARILQMVKDAADRKAPAELFMRKFARVYTPIVMILALLLAVVPAVIAPLAGFEYQAHEWIYRALVFLVISCPCALVISVPLGYYAGIGAASKAGVLFKGGNYLDALTRIDSIAFDKTGTLTTGRFEVSQLKIGAGFDRNRLLDLLLTLESKSTHPIALAVVRFAEREGASRLPVGSLTERPGFGVTAVIDGQTVLAGNMRLMDEAGIEVPEKLRRADATVVVCAVDGHFAGAAILEDALKQNARPALQQLHRMGIDDIHLLSGDKREIVDRYARALGINQAYAELLPQDKAEHIRRLLKQNRRVAFVGDGMNDAPVLALSDVGIAMGGAGSDAAVESADVVIQNDDPAQVAKAIGIARATRRVVKQNIVGAIGVKILILAAGALGFASMWAAVFADVGVALLAVANSMRLLRK